MWYVDVDHYTSCSDAFNKVTIPLFNNQSCSLKIITGWWWKAAFHQNDFWMLVAAVIKASRWFALEKFDRKKFMGKFQRQFIDSLLLYCRDNSSRNDSKCKWNTPDSSRTFSSYFCDYPRTQWVVARPWIAITATNQNYSQCNFWLIFILKQCTLYT